MSKENKEEEDIKKGCEVLPEDFASYDLSFKIIVIGNSGKYNL